MRKFLSCLLAASAFCAGTASADITTHLTEVYESGAVFEGNLLFSDGFGALLSANGALTFVNGYGDRQVAWTYVASKFGVGHAVDYDGHADTMEDWLMTSTPGSDGCNVCIGISWKPSTDGELHLTFRPGADSGLFTGVTDYFGSHDRVVSYNGHQILTAVPEPETYAMLLAGLGLVGFVARRRQKRA